MNINKRTVIGMIIAIGVLGGITWLAQPDAQTNNTATALQGTGGRLDAEEQSFDFGTISMAAGDVKHEFTINNTEGSDVTIDKMYTSCMCTTATLNVGGKKFGPYGMPGHGFIPKISQTIGPNEKATIEVVFDPAAHGPAGVGRIQRVVTIESDGGQPLELQFAALVTP
ncbi:MAG TPA: DUF1573 domain-containing protein [Candidatus Paceibacterota bacterium]